MTNKYALARAAAYLIACSLLLLLFTPLATRAFHRISPSEPEPHPAASASPVHHFDTGFTPHPPGAPIYDTLTVAQRIEQRLPTALPAAVPYYGHRVVYLTFDDGPDPDITPVILRILRQAQIKATFFIVGTQAEKSPALVKQLHQEGHAIGNHTYNHVYRDLYRSPAAYTAQLRRTDDILMKILGVRPRISRAPGGSSGSFTPEYWAALNEQGYSEVGWNISSGDASRAKAAQIAATVAQQAVGRPYVWSHAIVLMHDGRGHEETARALPEIIKFFKDRGFEFRVINHETPSAW